MEVTREKFSFSAALNLLKAGRAVTRANWYGSEAEPEVRLQRPDENSKMTEPYLYMDKIAFDGGRVRFPLDLSCESLLSEDWVLVE